MNLTTEEIIKGAREYYLIFGEDDGSVQFDYDADNEHKLLQCKFIPISDLIERKKKIEKELEFIADCDDPDSNIDYTIELKAQLNLINDLIEGKKQ